MNPTRTFIIRRTFVYPMALVIVLTAVLLVVCLVQGQAMAKVVILAGLVMPLVVIFAETAFRRVVVAVNAALVVRTCVTTGPRLLSVA
mgnify:CR=1 FL=1